MDFFDRQDSSRKSTGLLMAYFGLAVVLTIVLIYFLPILGWHAYKANTGPLDHSAELQWWYPNVFLMVCGLTLMVVLFGALFKISQLRSGGGGGVAEMLGGRQVRPETDDFFEKRLRNVVEEMAIASGVPVPPIYVMDREEGINAFAAGFSPADSVIAVTYGTMTGLTRDELQGVIAHEFSHILNSDMRINLNLMGFLHGLLILGLTGRILLQFIGYGGGGRRRDKDSGRIVFIMLAAAITLMIVGFAGYFFCKLIKASISRQRERLADASAVQFTRNPAGLAGALKKIGGLGAGSRIQSAQAEQASHMFFGNGLGRSMFMTHPPLTERVKWLEPAFNGKFKQVSREDLRAQLTQLEGAPTETKENRKPKTDFVDLFTDPGKVAVTATVLDAATQPHLKPGNPEALIDSIGKPMEHHADAARQLIESIPEPIKEHARDPYGARMLIYLLLLDRQAEIRDRQIAVVNEKAEPPVAAALKKALTELDSITPEMRLPIVDLSIPALRFLSADQYADFRAILQALIKADNQVDIFEYALQRVLRHHLDPLFSGNTKPRTANYYALRGLQKETAVALSALARHGNDDPQEQAEAFAAAAQKLTAQKVNLTLLSEEDCSWEQLDVALSKLNEGSFKVKKWLLGALLDCLMHDGEITIEETELFRAIADTLGCPVPPWVTPTESRD